MKDHLLHGKPPPRNPIEMLVNMPPELREELFKTAPPEIAELLRDMSPEMLEAMLSGLPGFDDEFFDDEDMFFL
jgi:hypothetical protein